MYDIMLLHYNCINMPTYITYLIIILFKKPTMNLIQWIIKKPLSIINSNNIKIHNIYYSLTKPNSEYYDVNIFYFYLLSVHNFFEQWFICSTFYCILWVCTYLFLNLYL